MPVSSIFSDDFTDVDMSPVLTVVQTFEFGQSLWVDLNFDVPATLAGFLDPVTTHSAIWKALPNIALQFPETKVTPTFSLGGALAMTRFWGSMAYLTWLCCRPARDWKH